MVSMTFSSEMEMLQKSGKLLLLLPHSKQNRLIYGTQSSKRPYRFGLVCAHVNPERGVKSSKVMCHEIGVGGGGINACPPPQLRGLSCCFPVFSNQQGGAFNSSPLDRQLVSTFVEPCFRESLTNLVGLASE